MLLLSDKNLGRTLSNSDFELANLVFNKATLLYVCPEVNMSKPRSVFDNTPTVSCCTREASTINLMVADLLCNRALHSRFFFWTIHSSTTQAIRTAWGMAHLVFWNIWHTVSCKHACHLPAAANSVETLKTAIATDFMLDLHTAHEAVWGVTTQYVQQKMLYQQWVDFFSTLLVVSTLQDSSLPGFSILQVYWHRIQHAHHSKKILDRLGKESFFSCVGINYSGLPPGCCP